MEGRDAFLAPQTVEALKTGRCATPLEISLDCDVAGTWPAGGCVWTACTVPGWPSFPGLVEWYEPTYPATATTENAMRAPHVVVFNRPPLRFLESLLELGSIGSFSPVECRVRGTVLKNSCFTLKYL